MYYHKNIYYHKNKTIIGNLFMYTIFRIVPSLILFELNELLYKKKLNELN